jgi:hypothetical protein
MEANPEGADTFGAEANQGEPDTTMPPTHPKELGLKGNKPIRSGSGSSGETPSGDNTRVPTPTNV